MDCSLRPLCLLPKRRMPNLLKAAKAAGMFGITLSKERKKNALLFIGHSCPAESGETRSARQFTLPHYLYAPKVHADRIPFPTTNLAMPRALVHGFLDTQRRRRSCTKPDKP